MSNESNRFDSYGRPMYLDTYEFRCAFTVGVERRCRKKVGTARWKGSYFDIEGTHDYGPYETDDEILRFNCPVHGEVVTFDSQMRDTKVVWVYQEER